VSPPNPPAGDGRRHHSWQSLPDWVRRRQRRSAPSSSSLSRRPDRGPSSPSNSHPPDPIRSPSPHSLTFILLTVRVHKVIPCLIVFLLNPPPTSYTPGSFIVSLIRPPPYHLEPADAVVQATGDSNLPFHPYYARSGLYPSSSSPFLVYIHSRMFYACRWWWSKWFWCGWCRHWVQFSSYKNVNVNCTNWT
jgi:hypothetical protein